MEEVSSKEYETWMEWLEMQWNIPTLDHYYMMRIAQRVLQAVCDPAQQRNITLEQQKVEFEIKKKSITSPTKPGLPSKEELAKKAAIEKAILFAVTGYKEKAPS